MRVNLKKHLKKVQGEGEKFVSGEGGGLFHDKINTPYRVRVRDCDSDFHFDDAV